MSACPMFLFLVFCSVTFATESVDVWFCPEDGSPCVIQKFRRSQEELEITRNDIRVVFDYGQNLMAYTSAITKKPCYVGKFDTSVLPPIEEAWKQAKEGKLEMPETSKKYNYHTTKEQLSMELSTLSKELCSPREIVVLEAGSPTSTTALSTVRQKREVGAGEVLVIIVVIIICILL